MKNKIEIGYKVLDEDMCSITKPLYEGGKKYFRNSRNFPKKNCGPLVLFKTLKSAKRYHITIRRIFKCRYKVSSKKKAYDLCGYYADKKGLAWSSSDEHNPYGTKDIDLADWIELLEEIK